MHSVHEPAISHRWKGKKRDEGSSGNDGIVLSLNMIGDGVYDAVYTVPITVGTDNQQFSLQVDTGSSDLWIASTSCSSSPCTSNKPQLYDPSSSTSTSQNFNITYLSGQVYGPIVWDKVVVGGYEIDNQALAAATDVENEPLAPGFSGILGLALPLNSIIAQEITPVTSNAPDGATFPSNLFGITPVDDAPAQYFYSLTLERPGSSKIPSFLGLGRHPDSIVPDPSEITYSTVVSEAAGTLFWKVSLKALTVYVNGTANSVEVGRGVSGSVYPEVVLDSGVPFIIGTPQLASGIWGALGIAPAADGNYYVPCSTPLNMTITLDDQSEIPLHPLDLSAPPQSDPSSKTCVGLIQQSSVLSDPNGDGDMILGVPFLRNVYTVMAYETPDSSGIIGNGSSSTNSSDLAHSRLKSRASIKPRLGLLSLTNSSTALTEFNQVRVLNQPLDQSSSPSGNTSSTTSDKKISVGLEVLFGLLGFVVLCGALFFVRWLTMRRRWARTEQLDGEHERGRGFSDAKDTFALASYELTQRPRSLSQVPTEDTQRTLLADESKKKRSLFGTDATSDSGRTHVDDADDGNGWGDDEFGLRRKKADAEAENSGDEFLRPDSGDPRMDKGLPVPPALHQRTPSELGSDSPITAVPLLTHTREESGVDDLAQFAAGEGMGMAGVGTARRSGGIDARLSTGMRRGSAISVSSNGSARAQQPTARRHASGPLRSARSISELSFDSEPDNAL